MASACARIPAHLLAGVLFLSTKRIRAAFGGWSGYALTMGVLTLSLTASHTVARELSGYETDREKFFRILLHDDRNSYYIISTDAGGQWSDTALKSSGVSSYSFNLVSNYYITHNGFSGKRRQINRTRQLNSLFFDLDCHAIQGQACDAAIKEALDRIHAAVSQAVLPMPSITVDSGRGVHLYYVLERSIPYRFTGSTEPNEKGIAFFQRVQNQLADVLEEVLQGVAGIEVDRAVFDHTRVSRIPDTYNPKAGRFARLVSTQEAFYHLPDLASYKPARKRQSVLPAQPSAKRSRAVVMNFHPLMMSRLNKVAELQAYRNFNCEGSRELMCFVYYNTAVQIYSREDARERLVAFNALFKAPLPASELNGIVKAVSEVTNVKGEKGYYILKADTLVRLLSLTEQEMLDLHFFSSKRMVERMEAKRRTKEKREQRDSRIIELYRSGVMTQREIGEAVGCTERTVHSVLKAAGLTRRNKTTATHKRTSLRELAKRALNGGTRRSQLSFSTNGAGSIFRTRRTEIFWRPCLKNVVGQSIFYWSCCSFGLGSSFGPPPSNGFSP